MRTTLILSVVAAILLACSGISAAQQYLPHADEQTFINPYAAEACAAPGYGMALVQPGYGPCGSNCCDDVWAGYCQQKKHGVCLPSLRPMLHRCPPSRGCGCSDCSGTNHTAPPRHEAAHQPTPTQKLAPLPPPTSQPEPKLAPEKAPPIDVPKEKPGAPETESPSDSTTSAPFPVFNPAAWRIVLPAK